MSDLHREVGALTARADAQQQRLERIEEKIDAMAETLAASKGGIRMLIAVGSLAAAIAGALGAWVAKLWPHS